MKLRTLIAEITAVTERETVRSRATALIRNSITFRVTDGEVKKTRKFLNLPIVQKMSGIQSDPTKTKGMTSRMTESGTTDITATSGTTEIETVDATTESGGGVTNRTESTVTIVEIIEGVQRRLHRGQIEVARGRGMTAVA
jgi:hypothetical protein